MDYKRERVNGSEFLLPATTLMRIVNSDGSERDNRTVFSNCHEFLGESTVSFGVPKGLPSSKPGAPEAPPFALPDGLPFEIALAQNIDTATAAVGDLVKARLTVPIRDRSSRILVPAGTPVNGRIVEMRHFYGKSSPVSMRFHLESLLAGGISQPFAATAVRPPPVQVRPGSLLRRDPLGTASTLRDPSGPATVFSDPTHDLVIKSGSKSNWVTGEIPKRATQPTTGSERPGRRDPQDLLADVLARLRPTLDRPPDYLCTQTIDRARYEPAGPSPGFSSCDDALARKEVVRESTSDRLRLDVAAGVNGEMYSWVGEKRFGDRGVDDFAAGGAFSTGTFSSLLKMIFTSEMADYSYDGEETGPGRTLTRFRFRVPLEKSHYYWAGPQGKSVLTAYSGTFSVDPATADLVRLAVRTGQLPAATGACEAGETLAYNRVLLGSADFLLPAHARLLVINADGSQSESVSAFSGCREFAGRSLLKFNAPGAPPAVAESISAAAPLPLPAGLSFTVAFTQDIDSATAAAGDPIAAKLTTALRDPSSTVLAPAGAAVTGRILRIRRYWGVGPALKIEFKLETVAIGGVPHPLSAVPSGEVASPNAMRFGSPEIPQPGVAVLYFDTANRNYIVGRGLSSNWVTDKP